MSSAVTLDVLPAVNGEDSRDRGTTSCTGSYAVSVTCLRALIPCDDHASNRHVKVLSYTDSQH